MERQLRKAKSERLSVIIVSDYAAGEEKSWDDLRRALQAWKDQEGEPAEEFLLAESARFEGKIPAEIKKIVPNLKIVYADADSSYELKNFAVEVSSGDWVTLVDADCIPQRSWLQVLRAAIAQIPVWRQSAPGACILVDRDWNGSSVCCPGVI